MNRSKVHIAVAFWAGTSCAQACVPADSPVDPDSDGSPETSGELDETTMVSSQTTGGDSTSDGSKSPTGAMSSTGGEVSSTSDGSGATSTVTGDDSSTTGVTPACGDGVIEDDEECDDGDANGEHAPCTPECTIAFCGDGYTLMAAEDPVDNEECDQGPDNGLGASCTEDCSFAALGVFVTSVEVMGDLRDHDPLKLSGLDGADAICRASAEAAGVPNFGSYRAWLSDSAQSSKSRFTNPAAPRPYALLDGTPIAASWSDLFDGAIENPITLTELWSEFDGMNEPEGLYAQNVNVWSNTKPDGTSIGGGQCCDDWSTSEDYVMDIPQSGRYGSTEDKDEGWTQKGSAWCYKLRRLYCVEQPVPVNDG